MLLLSNEANIYNNGLNINKRGVREIECVKERCKEGDRGEHY
jgi:hypothetical protein